MTFFRRLFSKFFGSTDCECPPGCTYCSRTGKCTCNNLCSPLTSAWPREDTTAARFQAFCDANPGHHSCRLYID